MRTCLAWLSVAVVGLALACEPGGGESTGVGPVGDATGGGGSTLPPSLPTAALTAAQVREIASESFPGAKCQAGDASDPELEDDGAVCVGP